MPPAKRFINGLAKVALYIGLAPKRYRILETVGRDSGRRRRTPVSVLADRGAYYLVSPYGETDWARNARSAGVVVLRRGPRWRRHRVTELEPAVPLLKKYVAMEPITAAYFDARPDAPDEDFAAEAGAHPVFRLFPID